MTVFLLFFNAHYELLEFLLPPDLRERQWVVVIDTTKPRFVERGKRYRDEIPVPVDARSLVVLKRL